jgi:hypothetical protein
MSRRAVRRRSWLFSLLLLFIAFFCFVPTLVSAHIGSLSASQQEISVPTWLFLMTGGGVIGGSFLLASFVTDRQFIRAIHSAHRLFDPTTRLVLPAMRVFGVLSLLTVLAFGFFGPIEPLVNLAVLIVWGAWWSGYSITTYLFGNSWPVLNPWRTIVDWLPTGDYDYPKRLGAWPSVIALLGLVWIEVVSPLASDPRLLAVVVLAYTIVTIAGAVAFGSETWFRRVDPAARVFRYYGRVAPITRTEDGFRLRLPGSVLTETRLVDGLDEVAFIVALLWVTSYDGFVATPLWRSLATPLVETGLPAAVLYPLALVVGFGVFLAAYRLATRYSKRYAETYLTIGEIARRFAPSLLPIAVGYHLAHYLGYFLQLLPMLLSALADPLSPGTPQRLVLPAWFGGLELAFVLIGHLLAIWVAHAIAYELFPSRLQAVRSQYSLTAVMVLYTVISLYIVSQPVIDPPYI